MLFQHGSLYLSRAPLPIYIIIFSSNFNCVVCLLRELCALHELPSVKLSCFDHVVMIRSECCGNVAWMSENLKKLPAADLCILAHHNAHHSYKSSLRSK